jgi:argininosuccinate lyase
VRRGIETGQDLSEMKIEALQTFSPVIAPDVYAVLTLEGSVAARNHVGGTAPEQVRAAIKRARKRL